MPKRNEHLIVIMLEKMPAGVEFEIWPQKITIVPWFPVDDEQKLDQLLSRVASKHKKFAVFVGETELWGKKQKFEVAGIEDPGQLHCLHWDIFHSLEKSGFRVHQKDFLGEKYRPHITVRNQRQKTEGVPPAGHRLKITNFTLVKQNRLKKTGRMIKSVKKEYELA